MVFTAEGTGLHTGLGELVREEERRSPTTSGTPPNQKTGKTINTRNRERKQNYGK